MNGTIYSILIPRRCLPSLDQWHQQFSRQ